MSAITASHAFCSSCGAGLTGRFCSNCGAAAGGSQDDVGGGGSVPLSERIRSMGSAVGEQVRSAGSAFNTSESVPLSDRIRNMGSAVGEQVQSASTTFASAESVPLSERISTTRSALAERVQNVGSAFTGGVGNAGSTLTAMGSGLGSTVDVTKQIGSEQVLPALKEAKRYGDAYLAPWFKLVFQPIRNIKACAARPDPRLAVYLGAYVAFAAIIGALTYYVLLGAAAGLDFPWTFTDRVDEFGIVAVMVGIAVNCLAAFVVFLLPDTLFEPVGKTRALCLFFLIMIYAEVYHTLTSLAFIVYWMATQDAETLAALKVLRTVAIVGFGLFAIRRGIGLSLDRSVAIVALSTLVTVVAAGTFFATGIWQIG